MQTVSLGLIKTSDKLKICMQAHYLNVIIILQNTVQILSLKFVLTI